MKTKAPKLTSEQKAIILGDDPVESEIETLLHLADSPSREFMTRVLGTLEISGLGTPETSGSRHSSQQPPG